MSEYRDYSDRLTIDFFEIESSMYSMITKAVISRFNLEKASAKVNGVDEIFQDFRVCDKVVGLEWDNWSGYMVNAKPKSAEPLVREMAEYINERFNS